jgi:hypothetical protein
MCATVVSYTGKGQSAPPFDYVEGVTWDVYKNKGVRPTVLGSTKELREND